MTLTIDRGIPPPPSRGISKRYPWSQMEIGDSFFVPSSLTKAATVRSATAYAKKRNGATYATSEIVENGVSGVRVWRIK